MVPQAHSKTEVLAKTRELVSQKVPVRTPELRHEVPILEQATLEQDGKVEVQQAEALHRSSLPLPLSTIPVPQSLAQVHTTPEVLA